MNLNIQITDVAQLKALSPFLLLCISFFSNALTLTLMHFLLLAAAYLCLLLVAAFYNFLYFYFDVALPVSWHLPAPKCHSSSSLLLLFLVFVAFVVLTLHVSCFWGQRAVFDQARKSFRASHFVHCNAL